MSVQYQKSGLNNGFILDFYAKLLEYDTTLSDSNMFYVQYDIPFALSEDFYRTMGETGNDGNLPINTVRNNFDGETLRTLTIGVDLPDDKNNMTALDHDSKVNGFVPITVNSGRSYESTGLTTSFYDTNLSLNDFIFKPWIRLISRYGSFNDFLYTNITVIFLGRKSDVETSIIRKQYNFMDCIPIDTQNKDSYKYDRDPKVIEQRVQWKFNRYDITNNYIQ